MRLSDFWPSALVISDHGTHRGDFQGVAPTGAAVECSAISVFRMADGRIAESWFNRDDAGVLRQLGALPAPAAVTA